MKLYIPTTSLNFNNILSTESISPKGFYAVRGFGYSRLFTIPENNLEWAILLYESPAAFIRPRSETEDHPLLIEIETDEDFPVAEKGVRYSTHSIYFNPWNTRFIFLCEEDRMVAYSLSDSSLETKMLRLYKKKIVIEPLQGDFPVLRDFQIDCAKDYSYVEQDRQINKIKGLLYGYYIGACLSSSKDEVDRIDILKEIQNIFASVNSSLERVPSKMQEERLEYLFSSYTSKEPLYRDLLEEVGSTEMTDKVLMILHRYGIEAIRFDWKEIVGELQQHDERTNHALEWVKSEIDDVLGIMESHRELLSPDAEEIITSNSKVSKVSSISNDESLLYISWINDVLIKNEFNGKISSIKRELADAITKSAKDTLADKWEESPIRTFLNQLRRHVGGGEFSQPWNNGILSSIAAVVMKGDDWGNLLDFMRSKGMTDYRLAFSFYGVLNGFANLTRDFTDILLNEKNSYVAEVYREFYGQLHGITIDMPKMLSQKAFEVETKQMSKESEGMQNASSVEKSSIEQQRKEIWEFYNSSIPKKGQKKEKLEEGLRLCLDRYKNHIDMCQFIKDLNDYDEFGWKKSNKPWKSMQEHFYPNYNEDLGINNKREKGEGLPSLFDGAKEVASQEVQVVKSYTPEKNMQGTNHDAKGKVDDSVASRKGKSIIGDRTWIDECASMISDSKARVQFEEDMEWFVGNHSKEFNDKKKGVVKGSYAEADCTNKCVIERLKAYMEKRKNPRVENMQWTAKYYANIPIDEIIDYIVSRYGI